ncbi:MAG: DUF1302 domain-containing protein [Proteobacteria bacterium]|nr:DUF1302 domain-containing protein [Pseudomonadota bacterium]
MNFKPSAARRIDLVLAIAACCVPAARAMEFETGNTDFKARWDNTVKYSAAWRTAAFDADVAGPTAANPIPNLDDGDRNFRVRGLISNRFDLLSEFDASYRNFGLRLSGAAWYDSGYHGRNDNDSPASANAQSVPHDRFTDATRKLQGNKAEMLDAFVSGRFAIGDSALNVRAGRFTQLYGESLFFGGNGIAAAQAPVDIVKALAVPNSQFKEILIPVGQVSAQWQVSPSLSAAAYLQTEWRRTRLPASGSYFSFGDAFGDGAERVLFGAPLVLGGGPAALWRSADITPRNGGQGGAALKWKAGDSEYGFYAARFHDHVPQLYLQPGIGGVDPLSGRVGSYALVYGQGITAYGASVSTVLGGANVAAEVSLRKNMPLNAVGNAVVDPSGTGNGSGNALFPVGRTLHAQVSAVSLLPAGALWQGASFVGELAFNRRLSVTANADQLDPHVTRDASALRFIFQPEYFQVLPGLDLQVPIGVGVGLSGFSSVNGVGFPGRHAGDFSVGVKGTYGQVWQGSINYTRFFGRAAGVIDANGALTGAQFHRDRDFIALAVQRTF